MDVVRWLGHPEHPLAIDTPEARPTTKKADIEKGEDNKDTRMWR